MLSVALPATKAPKSMVLQCALAGASGGAILGALLVCGLFWLVDLSSVPTDLAVLTLYGVGHFGLLGAVGGASVAVLGIVGARLCRHELQPVAFRRAVARLFEGSAFAAAASVYYVIGRRPTVLTEAGTMLPVVGAFAVAGAWSIVAYRRAISTSSPVSPTHGKHRPALVILLCLVVPPAYGIVRSSDTLVGDLPPSWASQKDTNRKLLIVGWDGATWDVIDPLLEQGRMPTIASLLERGSRGVLWASPQHIQPFANSASGGMRSPALWESMATGKTPRQHGIWDFQGKFFHGVTQPIPFRIAGDYMGWEFFTTSQLGRVQRFWEILDRADITTGVVGWLSTYPVTPLKNGVMVSDEAANHRSMAFYPPDLYDDQALVAGAQNEADRLREEFALLVPPSATLTEAQVRRIWEDLFDVYIEEYRKDVYKALAAVEIATNRKPDCLGVVLRVTDVAQHKLWKYYEPEHFQDVTDEQAERIGGLIPRAYELLDALLAMVIEAAGPEYSVMIVSDHGAGPWAIPASSPLKAGFHPEYSGNHRANGIVYLGGTGVRTGATLTDANGIDVAPTVLRLFGLPVGADMRGRVLSEALEAGGNPGTIPTYEAREWRRSILEPEVDETFDEEKLERLRSLGYVR